MSWSHPDGRAVVLLLALIAVLLLVGAWYGDRRNLRNADTPPPLDVDELHQTDTLNAHQKGDRS